MSPISLGIWATAGASAAAVANSYELISTAYGTGSSATITFSSIPSTYKHLQMRMMLKDTDAGTNNDNVTVRFNSDATTNYARHLIAGNTSSVTSANQINIQGIALLEATAGSGINANIYNPVIMDIPDYASTSKYKSIKAMTTSINALQIRLQSGYWNSTAAINSISIITNTPNWTTNSRISLYGIKG